MKSNVYYHNSMLKMISELENKPDFVIITGDLAYSGKPEEYKAVHNFCNFCDELLKASKLAQDRLYFVPGNHDVDRSRIKPKDIRSLYHFDSQEETETKVQVFERKQFVAIVQHLCNIY